MLFADFFLFKNKNQASLQKNQYLYYSRKFDSFWEVEINE